MLWASKHLYMYVGIEVHLYAVSASTKAVARCRGWVTVGGGGCVSMVLVKIQYGKRPS